MPAIASSLDPVAADAWAANELGFAVAKIGFLALGQDLRLGRADFRSLGPV